MVGEGVVVAVAAADVVVGVVVICNDCCVCVFLFGCLFVVLFA